MMADENQSESVDYSALSDKELEGAKAKLLKEFERIDGTPDNPKENISAADLDRLAELQTQLQSVKGEEGVRAAKREEIAQMREQIRAELTAEAEKDGGEGETEATETVEETVEETTTEETVEEAVVTEAEGIAQEAAEAPVAVAASVKGAVAKGRVRPPVSTAVRRQAKGVSIVASSDIPGISTGSVLDSDGLDEALYKRARALGDSRGDGTKAFVASVEKVNPKFDLRTLRNDGDIAKMWEQAHDTGSLVASGGWCAPSETIYDFACDFESMPEEVDLPTLTANRGGIRYPENVNLSDFLNLDGIGEVWTEADDIAAATPGGPVKVCATIPCPDFLESKLEAFYSCLRAGNLVDRSYPELVTRSRDLALTAHAHRLHAAKIVKMQAAAVAVVPTIDADLAATESTLGALEFELALWRDTFFAGADFVLEVVLPRWYRALIRRDLARRAGVPFDQVDNSTISSYFSEIGLRPQFVSNYQTLTPGSTAWPATVEMMFYPAGAFTLLDGGTLDIAVIRDSVLNATNDHTLLFFEEFWQLINRCGAFKMTIPVCATGLTGGPAPVACPTV